LATDNAVEASNRLTDLDDPNTRSGLYVARGVPNPSNWLGSGFLLHRLYDSNGFQMGCALGSGILQFRERDRGVWKQPVKLANLDSPAFTGTPTAPTPALTDNSTRLATTAHVTGSVRAALDAYAATRGRSSAQFGATGWWRCGDTGFIRQWGVSRIPYDSEAWVTYPIAFPNMCLGGNATHAERFLVTQDAGVGLIAAGSTAAIVRNGVGADSRAYLPNPADRASLIYWEVWGY
ncbi:gp53-like domain-containing protein, partial [Achromobacter xylosoxidans]